MLKDIQKHKNFLMILATILIFITGFIIIAFGEKLELIAYNLRASFLRTPADPNIVIVAITEDTISKSSDLVEEGLGRFPWPRPSYSKVIQFINEGNPRAIILDINLEGKSQFPDGEFSDQTFIDQLNKIPNLFFVQKVLLSGKLLKEQVLELSDNNDIEKKNLIKKHFNKEYYNESPGKLLNKFYIPVDDNKLNANLAEEIIDYYRIPKNLEGIYKVVQGIGINIIFPDSDKIIRSYQPVYRFNHKYLLSIPFIVYYSLYCNNDKISITHKILNIGNKQIPLNNKLSYYINWRSAAPISDKEYNYFNIRKHMNYKSISFFQVYFSDKYQIYSELFKDKIVIIGSTSDTLKDKYSIPSTSNYNGVEIIATVVDNIINDTQFITKASLLMNILTTIILLFTGISIFYMFTISKFKFTHKIHCFIFFLIIVIALYIVINYFIFIKCFYWIDLIVPLIVYIGLSCFLVGFKVILEVSKRTQVEMTFSKYVSPQIYQTLLDDYSSVSLKAKRQEITILFSDIRGFTSISEELYAEEVGSYLNQYFNEMVRVILKNNGTVDKFMGDAIMAFFGAPIPDSNHAFNAVIAALDMKHALQKLNEKWQQHGLRTLRTGIGINTGQSLVGNFGSDELMDFTAIGDPVNLASRLESLNKEENTEILISAYTYEKVKDFVEVNILGPRKVKGKAESVILYELTGLKQSSLSSDS
ncbi:MAG: adenylate/guanylate cyclase domain-containing protein [Cyanobacteriota bacterium]